jgi:hypothetical protein
MNRAPTQRFRCRRGAIYGALQADSKIPSKGMEVKKADVKRLLDYSNRYRAAASKQGTVSRLSSLKQNQPSGIGNSIQTIPAVVRIFPRAPAGDRDAT